MLQYTEFVCALCEVRTKKGTQCSSWKTSREDQEISVFDVFHSTFSDYRDTVLFLPLEP